MALGYSLVIILCFMQNINAMITPCDVNIMKAFSSNNHLEPSAFEYYVNGKDFWRVSNSKNEQKGYAFTISYSDIYQNLSNVTVVLYDSNGDILIQSTDPYTEGLEGRQNGYYFSNSFQGSFPFKCTDKLAASYRCQIAGPSGVGPVYAIHAMLKYTLSDVEDELETCKKMIMEIDRSVEFVDMAYPSWS